MGTHARGNVVSWVPSPKLNNKTFATESRGAEWALNTLMQFDSKVLWYGDQPEPVDIVRSYKNGRKRRASYTPDGVSFTSLGPIVYEAKTLSDVEKLLVKYPSDWKRLESNAVVYIPAKEAFMRLGLTHKVYIYKPEDYIYITNLDHILWARASLEFCSPESSEINKAFEMQFVLTLAVLQNQLKLSNQTPLIRAIDEGHIVVDLKDQLITDSENCLASTTHALLEHGKELRRSQLVYRKDLVNSKNLSLVPSLKGAEGALVRLEALNKGLSNRSTRRWKARIKAGEQLGLSPFQSLISNYHRCGNRKKNLNYKVQNFLNNYLLNSFIHRQGISEYRGFVDYQSLARDAHPEFSPVSHKTFTRHLSKIPPEVIAYAKGGNRMGNQMALPTDPEHRHLKAQTAWERAAIDHYCVDLYLVVYAKKDKIVAERPWLTLMVDLYTGKVLAFSISFKKPSRHSVAKVLRSCVRNHGSLPREIIFDRGAEFKSVYLASLLAHYSVILSLRPAGNPRYGGEVEGFFGEFKKLWLCQRSGNLANYKEARAVDGKKTPKKAAVLFPADFHRELKLFCAWRENACRGTGGHSAEILFEQSCKDYPYVSRTISYDAEFIIVTCVEAKKYTVDMQRGINVLGTWYSSPAMQLLLSKPRKNEVRLDPENPNLIFVKVCDQWEPFYSSEINAYSAKSPEHQLAEGMIKHEAANLKKKIRFEDDIDLARLVHEMDRVREEQEAPPILEFEMTESITEEQVEVFSKLKNTTVRPLNIRAWEA
ncbi:integrase catalytic domain-containing protein [Aliikangiella coralliicola]|uniref:integrase catalytic domain-containing protein n=1 Tax=Aliikangiella coralliicola TaxID=2592383 RepID=UPI00143D7A23|nr:DDE-type integrase/transposase/recombinase [Aliikangiella coralliicola]